MKVDHDLQGKTLLTSSEPAFRRLFFISNRHRDEGDIPEESLHWIRAWGPFLESPDN